MRLLLHRFGKPNNRDQQQEDQRRAQKYVIGCQGEGLLVLTHGDGGEGGGTRSRCVNKKKQLENMQLENLGPERESTAYRKGGAEEGQLKEGHLQTHRTQAMC